MNNFVDLVRPEAVKDMLGTTRSEREIIQSRLFPDAKSDPDDVFQLAIDKRITAHKLANALPGVGEKRGHLDLWYLFLGRNAHDESMDWCTGAHYYYDSAKQEFNARGKRALRLFFPEVRPKIIKALKDHWLLKTTKTLEEISDEKLFDAFLNAGASAWSFKAKLSAEQASLVP